MCSRQKPFLLLAVEWGFGGQGEPHLTSPHKLPFNVPVFLLRAKTDPLRQLGDQTNQVHFAHCRLEESGGYYKGLPSKSRRTLNLFLMC